MSGGINAGHDGHGDVHEDDVEGATAVFVGVECFEAVGGCTMGYAEFAHGCYEELEIYLIIFDQEDAEVFGLGGGGDSDSGWVILIS